MVQTDITVLSCSECFQKIMNYAGPILLSVETAQVLTSSTKVASEQVWYYVMATTRILIAHCSIMNSQNRKMLMMIAHNIRNLYRLFGLDLSDKRKWRSIVLDVMYYALPNKNNTIYFDVHKIDELKQTSYETVFDEFKHEDKDITHYIGHIVYNLVAKRDENWKSALNQFATLEI